MLYVRKILRSLFTACYAIAFFIITLLCLPIVPLARLLDGIFKTRLFIPITAHLWGRIVVRLTLSPVRIIGQENIPNEKSNVEYIVNHQGFFDIPLLLGFVDCRIRFVARENLFNVPLLGIFMKSLGCVAIGRRISKGELKKFEQISQLLASGGVMAIFPEGTRSRDGTFGKFHTSAFRPARIAHSTIVPVLIWGSHRILPRGKKTVSPTKITIVIGNAITHEDYVNTAPKELAEKMADELKKMKRENIT